MAALLAWHQYLPKPADSQVPDRLDPRPDHVLLPLDQHVDFVHSHSIQLGRGDFDVELQQAAT